MRWGMQILPKAIVVRLFGNLDHSVSGMWEKAAERVVHLKKNTLIVDFSEVESVDVLGGVLCGYGLHHCEMLGIPVALVRPPGVLLPMLQKQGLGRLHSVFMEQPDMVSFN